MSFDSIGEHFEPRPVDAPNDPHEAADYRLSASFDDPALTGNLIESAHASLAEDTAQLSEVPDVIPKPAPAAGPAETTPTAAADASTRQAVGSLALREDAPAQVDMESTRASLPDTPELARDKDAEAPAQVGLSTELKPGHVPVAENRGVRSDSQDDSRDDQRVVSHRTRWR